MHRGSLYIYIYIYICIQQGQSSSGYVCPYTRLERCNQFSYWSCCSQFEARVNIRLLLPQSRRLDIQVPLYVTVPEGPPSVGLYGQALTVDLCSAILICREIKFIFKHSFRIIKFHIFSKINPPFLCNKSFLSHIL
jgi:hypothetical protein